MLWVAWAMSAVSLAWAGTVPDEGVLALDESKHVDLSFPALRITGSPITVQAWFKTGSGGPIFECGWENRAPGPQAGYMLYFAGGGRLRFGVNNGAEGYENALWDDLTTRDSYNDDKWHQATGVFCADGETRVKLYIDGVEVALSQQHGAAQTGISRYTYIPETPVARIGMMTDPVPFRKSGLYSWRVSLDEIRVWKIALSREQIQANWDKPVDPATPGLVAYYKFDEAPSAIGDAVRDSAGGDHGVVAKYEYAPPYEDPLLPVDPVAFPENDFDYAKYPEAITGYNGQDRQRIALVRWEEAARRRVGARGNYKASFTRMGDGRLVLAACREEAHPTKPSKTAFQIYVYESVDEGVTWKEIAKPGIMGKEPSLDVLPDGALFLIAQDADFTEERRHPYAARSADGGRTWEFERVEGIAYPRQVVIERDGTILFAMYDGWNLKLARSQDAGRTWSFSRGKIDWELKEASSFDEVGLVRLAEGTLLATFRRNIPGFRGEGFEQSMITRSTDDGLTWSKPVQIGSIAEVHYYVTELSDGRLLASYSNYHLPYGAWAIVSRDGGRTWDREHPIELAVSSDIYTAWPVTREMPDGTLITCYAVTLYAKEDKPRTATEVVRWRLPATGETGK
ncbi:MAG: LamG-like jellyroll fold domain-containing protein [Planctomycetota bacterium]